MAPARSAARGHGGRSPWPALESSRGSFGRCLALLVILVHVVDDDFVDDLVHWNEKDYWATPIEFIATGAGDCEDYTIAKYFSLIELGVPESQLRLMYVTALELRQPHMVLAYYETPTSVPLVLDNINRRILPANKRRDLSPIYSFNGNGLWAAKAMGTGRKLRGSGPMKMWDDMVERLDRVMYGDKEK